MCICVHAYLCACTYVHVVLYIRMCVHMYIRTYVHVYCMAYVFQAVSLKCTCAYTVYMSPSKVDVRVNEL